MEAFRQKLLKIAVPITIQNLISVGLNLVDNLMIGQLGAVAIASVGLVNQVMFILMLVTFGAASGAGVFVSQYWGVRDTRNIEKTIAHMLYVTFGAALVFFVILFFLPGQTLGLFSKDSAVIKSGISYSTIVAFTVFFTSFSFVIASALRTVEKAQIPMYISLVALGFNTLGNYLLIFGIGPFPELGVAGAAIATLFSRSIEFLLYLFVLNRKRTPVKVTFQSFFKLDRFFFARMMKIASPVIANEFMWSLGMAVYSLVFARVGTAAIATRNIVSTIESFGFVFFGGIGSAAVVIVGSELGRKNFDLAFESAKRLLKITLIISSLAGLAIIGLSRVIINFYNIDDFIRATALLSIIIVAVALPIKMLNAVNLVGVLRSGGDTRTVFFLEIVSLWLIGVPMVLFGGLILKLSVPLIYIMMLPEELFKLLVGGFRFRSRKWMKNIIEQ
ncbi:MATE family efflux transporter [Kosmotoga arenicorallina]|uniref:MATE family efflux transporter n=1 Tax=Kosmotoga arenicorallina TaxID=688066 RepID=UPI000833E1EE|nr:MATE family efflux transporter [Kosmotoga arenicorallina]